MKFSAIRASVFLTTVTCLISACATPQGVPTDLANACNPDNEKKYLEVAGNLVDRGSVFCSNTGGRMECGFDLFESPGSEKKLRIDVEQGSGANTVDKIERGYKREDIKIRDNSGNPVALGEKVRVTGRMSIAPGAGTTPGVCFMQVEKIEAAK